MAAKPIERFVKKQIQEQGGFGVLVERIASGVPISRLAQEFKRPDGKSISRGLLSAILHQDEERSKRIHAARLDGAHALADHALEVVRDAPLDRDAIQKAKVVADVDLRLAGLWNREDYGEAKHTVAVQVNVNDMHLSALRHREVLGSNGPSAIVVGACEPLSLPKATVTSDSNVTPSPDHG